MKPVLAALLVLWLTFGVGAFMASADHKDGHHTSPGHQPRPAPIPGPDPEPTPEPEPTPAPEPSTMPEDPDHEPAPDDPASIRACPHDSTRWHGVVEYAADGSVRCTYGHEHKDDPRLLDRVFGPLLHGEISHPWETHRENELKHRVYAWHVKADDACWSSLGGLGFRNSRMQVHADGNSGATVRFHSFSRQAELCDVNDSAYLGYLETGGHLDFGGLFIDSAYCPSRVLKNWVLGFRKGDLGVCAVST